MAVSQLKAGAALSYVVLGLNAVVGLFYMPYMLRTMGQSEWGLYSLVASVIGYLTILDLGFGNAIIRYTAKFRAEGKLQEQYSMFGMFFIFYCLIALVALILGGVLYFNVDALFGRTMSPEELRKASTLVIIMVLNLAVTFPMSIFGSIISAYENFVFQKVVQIVRVLLSTVTMILLLRYGYRAIAMAVVTTVFNFSTLLINALYCTYRLQIKLLFRRFDWRFLKEVGIYTFYIFLNIIIDKIYWNTGQFVLGAISGTVAVAVFAVAIMLQGMYMNLSTAVTGIFLPRVTAIAMKEDSEGEISDLFIRLGRIQYIILAYLLSGFILFGRQFIQIWAGAGYDDAYIITLLFFVPLTVPLIQTLGLTILQARNRLRFRSLLYLAIALLSVALQILFARRWGGVGCAVGIAIPLVLGQIVIMNIYYYRYQAIDIPRFWREIIRMSLIPTAVAATCWAVMRFLPTIDSIGSLLGAIALYSAIYMPLFWKFSMNNSERELILSPLRRVINRRKTT